MGNQYSVTGEWCEESRAVVQSCSHAVIYSMDKIFDLRCSVFLVRCYFE
jgi:hypothetical protein